jgi:hypothetical protein
MPRGEQVGLPEARRTRHRGQRQPDPGVETLEQVPPVKQLVPDPRRLQLRRDQDRTIAVDR